MAGLLTRSGFARLPIFINPKTVALPDGNRMAKHIKELTAAGTVQEFHLIPFSSP